MNVFIGRARVRLSDRDLLGVGGEGRVYAFRDLAVKIYHKDLAPRSSSSGSAGLAPAELRRMALAKVASFPRTLPPEVVAPSDVVSDERGDAVGFAMPIVRGATEAMRLSHRKWRDGNVSSNDVVAIFRRVHAALRALHAHGVVAGDFNDGNVLFVGTSPRLIDCDSMQLGGYPCPVAHERFLDPRLYGKDLARSPAFSEASDWYAFTVMLFSSLLYVHPYGGAHPRYPTLLRRAEARHSILRPDVTYPKAALPFRALPDELLDIAEATFDRDARGAFPEAALSMTWTRCGCGVEHARRACPACSPQRLSTPLRANAAGKCRAVVVRRTQGRILFATSQGGLRYLVEEDGGVFREDGTRVLDGLAARDTTFAIAGRSTWVARGERATRVVDGSARESVSTTRFRDAPAFDANAATACVIDGDFLVDVTRGARLGQVLGGQTWFRLGDDVGFGFYRTGAIVEYFTFRTSRGGIRSVAVPDAKGKLVDCAAWFDRDIVLFALAVDVGGKRVHAMHLIENGEVVASMSGAPDDRPMLASLGGKCVGHGAVLAPTDEGLVLARADRSTGELVQMRTFPETAPFVSQASEILPGPGGSVHVVNAHEIVQLSLG